MLRRKAKPSFGPQPGVHKGCYGCAQWPEQIRETCLVDGCEQRANTALMDYSSPSPQTGSRRWYYLCGHHARQLSAEMFVNVGSDGPFNQDVRLRMFA